MNFKSNEGYGPFKSQKQYELIVQFIVANNVPIYAASREEKNIHSYPYLLWNGEYLVGHRDSCGNILSLESFLDVIENYSSNMISLTDDYNAIVSKDGIHVGCQTISFEKFEELKALVDKIKLTL